MVSFFRGLPSGRITWSFCFFPFWVDLRFCGRMSRVVGNSGPGEAGGFFFAAFGNLPGKKCTIGEQTENTGQYKLNCGGKDRPGRLELCHEDGSARKKAQFPLPVETCAPIDSQGFARRSCPPLRARGVPPRGRATRTVTRAGVGLEKKERRINYPEFRAGARSPDPVQRRSALALGCTRNCAGLGGKAAQVLLGGRR